MTILNFLTKDSNTVSLGIANVVNSTYMCRVQRILAQKLPNPDPRIKPLNTSYYVFLASGPATSCNSIFHKI